MRHLRLRRGPRRADLGLHAGGRRLRNTIGLNGRAGVGRGRVHWTANFDELQDFENDIRGDSPCRALDGTLGDEARRGRGVFNNAGGATCQGGPNFTDLPRHDVGTIRPGSGQGLGQPLAGVVFDTPTLRGLWDGPPYLHDGSAATLEQALERHGQVPALSEPERAQLSA